MLSPEWGRLFVFARTIEFYISEQMFVNHSSAQKLTCAEYHKLFLFFVLVATAYWSPLPITPLIKKSDPSQLTSLMLSSNFVCAVCGIIKLKSFTLNGSWVFKWLIIWIAFICSNNCCFEIKLRGRVHPCQHN